MDSDQDFISLANSGDRPHLRLYEDGTWVLAVPGTETKPRTYTRRDPDALDGATSLFKLDEATVRALGRDSRVLK